jgi:hypothetical protein
MATDARPSHRHDRTCPTGNPLVRTSIPDHVDLSLIIIRLVLVWFQLRVKIGLSFDAYDGGPVLCSDLDGLPGGLAGPATQMEVGLDRRCRQEFEQGSDGLAQRDQVSHGPQESRITQNSSRI